MVLQIRQTATAVGLRCKASFGAYEGTEPYTFAVTSGFAGGTINASTGAYTAPSTLSNLPEKQVDYITVTDADLNTAQTTILIGTPLTLFCEIIQKEMGLANGRVFLWDQKLFQPTDNNLYIAVSMPICKPFGVSVYTESELDALAATQSVNMQATLDIDIISRGPQAMNRKEEVILALNSVYSIQQQDANSFYIAKLPPGNRFVNLSMIDGAAIPYRYRISYNIQYMYTKSKNVDYFDDFSAVQVVTERSELEDLLTESGESIQTENEEDLLVEPVEIA